MFLASINKNNIRIVKNICYSEKQDHFRCALAKQEFYRPLKPKFQTFLQSDNQRSHFEKQTNSC